MFLYFKCYINYIWYIKCMLHIVWVYICIYIFIIIFLKEKAVTQQYETTTLQRCHWVRILLVIYGWACSSSFRVVCFPRDIPLGKKTKFLYASAYQQERAFWIRDSHYTYSFSFRTPSVTAPVNPVHVASISESSLYWSCWFRGLCFLSFLFNFLLL